MFETLREGLPVLSEALNAEKVPDFASENFCDASAIPFYRMVQELVICTLKEEDPNKEIARAYIEEHAGCITQSVLSNICQHPRILLIETFIMVQSVSLNTKLAAPLISLAQKCPSYLIPYICVAIMQCQKLGHVLRGGLPAPVPLPSSYQTLSDEIFAPLIFFHNLSPSASIGLNKLLKNYDIFQILLTKWIQPCKTLLTKQCFSIVSGLVSDGVSLFLSLYQLSTSGELLKTRILPVLSVVHRKESAMCASFLSDHRIFAMKALSSHFSSLLPYAASCCNSPQNAEIVLRYLVEYGQPPLAASFAHSLRTESSSTPVSLDFLRRVCKYLHPSLFADFLDLIGVDDMSLFMILAHYLSNDRLYRYAAKAAYEAAKHRPAAAAAILTGQPVRELSQDSVTALSLCGVSRAILAVTFKYGVNPLQAKLDMPTEILQTVLPGALYRHVETPEKKWKLLSALVDLASDAVSTSLIPLTDEAIIALLYLATIEVQEVYEGNDDKEYRFDREMTRGYNEVVIASILLSYRILDVSLSEKVSEILRGGKLVTSLIKRLADDKPSGRYLRAASLKLLTRLSAIAQSLSLSLDSLYPKSGQTVLTSSAKHNLLHGSPEAAAFELDFVAETLYTQPALGFSLARRLGAAFVSAAVAKSTELIDQPKLVLSLSRLTFSLFRTLDSRSLLLNDISQSTGFWDGIKRFLQLPAEVPEIASAQANFIETSACELVAGGRKDIVNPVEILKKAALIYPIEVETTTTRFEIDWTKFTKTDREYGENFMIDTSLLEWYMAGEDYTASDLLNFTSKVNISLSRIDAATKLAASVRAYVVAAAAVNDRSLIPDPSSLLAFIEAAVGNRMTPDSTLTVMSDLVEKVYEHFIPNGSVILPTKTLDAFKMARETPSIHRLLTTLLRFSKVQEEARSTMQLLFDKLKDRETLSELALKLSIPLPLPYSLYPEAIPDDKAKDEVTEIELIRRERAKIYKRNADGTLVLKIDARDIDSKWEFVCKNFAAISYMVEESPEPSDAIALLRDVAPILLEQSTNRPSLVRAIAQSAESLLSKEVRGNLREVIVRDCLCVLTATLKLVGVPQAVNEVLEALSRSIASGKRGLYLQAFSMAARLVTIGSENKSPEGAEAALQAVKTVIEAAGKTELLECIEKVLLRETMVVSG